MPTPDSDLLKLPRDVPVAWERHLRPARDGHGWLWLALGVLVVFLAFRLAEGLWAPAAAPAKSRGQDMAAPRAVEPAPRAEPASPAPSRAQARPAPRVASQCIAPDGRTVGYSDGPCPAGTRQRDVALDPDRNLADGLSAAERAAHRQENREIAVARLRHEWAVAQNVDVDPSARCRALDQHIAWLDAAARQPNTPSMHNDIRAKRRAARDEQFALGCQRVR